MQPHLGPRISSWQRRALEATDYEPSPQVAVNIVKELQHRLWRGGFYGDSAPSPCGQKQAGAKPNPADGKLGPKTNAAITAFLTAYPAPEEPESAADRTHYVLTRLRAMDGVPNDPVVGPETLWRPVRVRQPSIRDGLCAPQSNAGATAIGVRLKLAATTDIARMLRHKEQALADGGDAPARLHRLEARLLDWRRSVLDPMLAANGLDGMPLHALPGDAPKAVDRAATALVAVLERPLPENMGVRELAAELEHHRRWLAGGQPSAFPDRLRQARVDTLVAAGHQVLRTGIPNDLSDYVRLDRMLAAADTVNAGRPTLGDEEPLCR